MDPELNILDPKLGNIGPFHVLRDLENELNKRRTANGLAALPSAVVQDRLCQHLPPGYCNDESNHPTREAGAMSLTLADVVQGTRTLASWFAQGRQRVSRDEAMRRIYICNSCPRHVPIHGCQGCSGHTLRNLVSQVVASETLPTDAMLGGCSVCHCALPAKVRLPLSVILPHMPPAQRAQLWEKCWLREGED